MIMIIFYTFMFKLKFIDGHYNDILVQFFGLVFLFTLRAFPRIPADSMRLMIFNALKTKDNFTIATLMWINRYRFTNQAFKIG